jgi:virginiamycin A acetyltransferase
MRIRRTALVFQTMGTIRRGLKSVLDVMCLVLVAPAGLSAMVEARLSTFGEDVFAFWAHVFALAPGVPGAFLRRAYYRLTLDGCAGNFFVGFGAFFSHRRVIIEEDVYVGPYAIVGCAVLRKGCMVGTRTSVISGARLHTLEHDGRWGASDLRRLQQIEIGAHALIGEGCIVMANVGASALVAAGSVVSGTVPTGVVVAGNPARFVRSLSVDPDAARSHGA